MKNFEPFWNEIVSFFGITNFFQILNSGDYVSFLFYHVIVATIQPILPLLLVFEFVIDIIRKNPESKVYQTIFLIHSFNRFIGRFIDIYFGQFIALFMDVVRAPGQINKLAYILLPPGLDYNGNHRKAKMIRDEYL